MIERKEKKILVFEDDADISEMLVTLLLIYGYEVKALPDGKNLFENVVLFAPDLVLMDIMLAELDGGVLCRALKEDVTTALLPVILLSAGYNLQSCLLQKGAPNDFIAKPFDIDHLLGRISFHLAA